MGNIDERVPEKATCVNSTLAEELERERLLIYAELLEVFQRLVTAFLEASHYLAKDCERASVISFTTIDKHLCFASADTDLAAMIVSSLCGLFNLLVHYPLNDKW